MSVQQLDKQIEGELTCPYDFLQATVEKASIDEVYIDITNLVDAELQVRVRALFFLS